MISPEHRTDKKPQGSSTEATAQADDLSTREIAEETLQGLIPFVAAVRDLCSHVGEGLWSGNDVAHDFARVMDGIEILVEGVQTSRIVLQIEKHELCDALHQELVAHLRSLEAAMNSSDENALSCRVELLTQSLPANLEQWVSTGIPSLVRSRDS